MGGDRRARRDPDLPFQEIDGMTLVLVPGRLESHELDEAGSLLWRELERRRSVEELAASLCDEFEVEPERAQRDVRSFLDQLVEKGLVIEG